MTCAPGAQQLDAGLVADLHAPAGEQRHAAAQIRALGALGEVELRARRAELVVEMMEPGVVLLADVAVLRLDRIERRRRLVRDVFLDEIRRREHVRGREHHLAAQLADAGLREHALLVRDPGATTLAPRALRDVPPQVRIRTRDAPRRLEETDPFRLRETGELGTIGDERLEELDRRPDAVVGGGLQDRVGRRRQRGRAGHPAECRRLVPNRQTAGRARYRPVFREPARLHARPTGVEDRHHDDGARHIAPGAARRRSSKRRVARASAIGIGHGVCSFHRRCRPPPSSAA